MKKHFRLISVFVVVMVLLLALSVGLGLAQEQNPPRDNVSGGDAVQSRSSYLPVQGRLTDAAGAPLNGTYDLTFRIYDVFTGGTALCEDVVPTVSVTGGLFSTAMDMQGCSAFDGRQLYLGIQVAADPEMTPRAFVDNVPYAWTLRPGAEISSTIGGDAILDIDNYSPTGRGLRAEIQATSGENMAVLGASRSPQGFGGYFYNNGGGTGLYGKSDTGAAIVAGGTGVIRSSAQSSLWISGNGLRAYNETNTTVSINTAGGARITRNATVGDRYVMLPIAVPGTLYGQNVTVTGLDITYITQTDFDVITDVRLRRQIGACDSCFVEIYHDAADHVCDAANHSTGCTLHFDLTTNNALSADSGVLHLGIGLAFSGASTWVDIGGVRLTLEHE
jgi:hypothetical protein